MASVAEVEAAEEEGEAGEPLSSWGQPRTVPPGMERSATACEVNGWATARSETAFAARSAMELSETAIAQVMVETFNTRDWLVPLSPGGEFPSVLLSVTYRPTAR